MGERWDLVLHPCIQNLVNAPPSAVYPADDHVLGAHVSQTFQHHRIELDRQYGLSCDLEFIQDDHVYARATFTNPSDRPAQVVLNLHAGMIYPRETVLILKHPEGSRACSAIDYQSLEHAVKRLGEGLPPDGCRLDEAARPEAWQGRALATHPYHLFLEYASGFGSRIGDQVEYTFVVDKVESGSARILLHLVRDRAVETISRGEHRAVIEASIDGVPLKTFDVPYDDEWTLLETHHLEAGDHSLTLKVIQPGWIFFDALVFGSGSLEPSDVELVERSMPYQSKLSFLGKQDEEALGGLSLLLNELSEAEVELRYDLPKDSEFRRGDDALQKVGYCISVDSSDPNAKLRLRRLPSGSIEDAVPVKLSNPDPTMDQLMVPQSAAFSPQRSGAGEYINIVVHDLTIPPSVNGEPGSIIVDVRVRMADEPEAGTPINSSMVSAQIEARKEEVLQSRILPSDDPYAASVARLQDTLLTNTVYPIYLNGRNIRHFTPGKRWDCLYTWDSGFIVLGLLTFAPDQALEQLAYYLEDTPDNHPFSFHGSPVPVQLLALYELRQRYPERKAEADRFYPAAKRMWLFLAGIDPRSDTDRFNNGLLSTYMYFYNASGMDDDPAQVATHRRGMSAHTAPIITSAMVIRTAYILARWAENLGLNEDAAIYLERADKLRTGLLRDSWDEESGYFAFTVYDDEGELVEKLRTEDGELLSKGLHGAYPLLDPQLPAEYRERLLEHLRNYGEIRTARGLSAVDRSASYSENNGYWNGNIWFPHQYIFWQMLLSLGEADLAHWIADTALREWARESDYRNYTWECINIETGQGGWFHHFGGLSAPLLNWAAAYGRQGEVTAGFDLVIDDVKRSDKGFVEEINCHSYSDQPQTLLIVQPKTEHQNAGTYSITASSADSMDEAETLAYIVRNETSQSICLEVNLLVPERRETRIVIDLFC